MANNKEEILNYLLEKGVISKSSIHGFNECLSEMPFKLRYVTLGLVSACLVVLSNNAIRGSMAISQMLRLIEFIEDDKSIIHHISTCPINTNQDFCDLLREINSKSSPNTVVSIFDKALLSATINILRLNVDYLEDIAKKLESL